MAGNPVKRQNRALAKKMMNDPTFWDFIFAEMANGQQLPALSTAAKIKYATIYSRIKADPDLSRRYDEARNAQAAWNESQINRIAEHVEYGGLDPHRGRIALDARKWLASRQDPATYGERTQHDIKITSIHKLHLDAHQDLAKRMKVIDEIDEEEDQKTIEHKDSE